MIKAAELRCGGKVMYPTVFGLKLNKYFPLIKRNRDSYEKIAISTRNITFPYDSAHILIILLS